MADFMTAHKLTAINEGGYANDPDDSGGETWKGIARKKHPGWYGWELVDMWKRHPLFPKILYDDKMLQMRVHNFYLTNFWKVIKGEEIIKQEVANPIYDNAVNVGPSAAIKAAQKVLGLPITGKMDKRTLDKLNNK